MPALTRRHLLQHLSTLAAGSAVGLPAYCAYAAEWGNWSGNQSASPAQFIYASDEAHISEVVRAAKQLRVVGGSHSFSALVPSDDTLLSLEALNGAVSHDTARHQGTYWAGSRLAQVSALAAAAGQSLINEPDINVQSLGGAISTATHGTGGNLTCLSANVTNIRLITADGIALDCSAQQHSEIFNAARVGLGCLGVMSQITLQN
ncbi:FAD-binding protein [Atopomonas sediminilitoris]|uniref:FAD-binding protein n=1 Tax=Atopomonas sediminilitoris TaxID=2919919 RepID=UPI001F4E01CB|nr:FAD-binding protein [Atopomonas sediminilitoris]MCJ8169051.1 FAD-binding protein [Atopomonas sediminilitoris]